MSNTERSRREFIKTLMTAMGVGTLDWSSLPIAEARALGEDRFDAVIIGSGLGGLSCAAAFAR